MGNEELPEAQKDALVSARWGETLGGYYIPMRVHDRTVAALMKAGLVGKRPGRLLTSKGERIRRALTKAEDRGER